ncbi:MAG: type IX secretion system membrane protein PorP/SprF [Vicingaceae bacterium]|nr:type IX secretion system membrane protein PorP/SprF [Vicingaceae bacterium]
MRKVLLSLSLTAVSSITLLAQQDAQFTQNMFNKLSINPGSAGHNGGICGTLLTRQQWTGFEGNPQTHLFSADARFSKHGVGLTVFQDKLGIETSFVAKLAYAYHLQLGPGELGIGIEGGMLSKKFGDNFIAIDDPNLDPSIPNAGTSASTFDFGAGLYYSIANKMYVGISTLHIPQTSVEDAAAGTTAGDVGALNFEQSRHYYIMAGYDWDINNDKKWILKPSILAKTDAASTQLDVNVLIEYNMKVWGGVTYRIEDAIGIIVGANIGDFIKLPGLKLGVAYDLTTSSLGDHSSGSFELMLRYCTSIYKQPKREVYRSVRFL